MAGRRFEDGIPGDLPVVVRVHVDETGGHDAARSVDLLVGFAFQFGADCDDLALKDCHITAVPVGAGSVDDDSVAYQ